MIIKLKEIKANDFVYCTGDSGFCDSSDEKVEQITVQYDENDGSPYNVIWLPGGRKFDSRDGGALNSPTAYYLVPTEQDNAKTKQEKKDKEKKEREIEYTKTEADKKTILNKLTFEEQKILGF